MGLIDDLAAGEAETARQVPCPLCELIQSTEDPAEKNALVRAASGSIGMDRLGKIFSRHGLGIGWRTIQRHRREEHTPL